MDLSMPELEALINYWRVHRPASGNDFALSPQVNVLAGVYAQMIYKGFKTLPVSALNTTTRQLLETWRLRPDAS